MFLDNPYKLGRFRHRVVAVYAALVFVLPSLLIIPQTTQGFPPPSGVAAAFFVIERLRSSVGILDSDLLSGTTASRSVYLKRLFTV